MKHITRFEYGNTRGWWVRIRRKPNPCSKLFSDGKYGGKEQALEKAVAWREEKLKTRPPLAYPIEERGNKQVYCAEDETVKLNEGERYRVSAAHLLVPTLGEYMKAANPASRNVAVAGKDAQITDRIDAVAKAIGGKGCSSRCETQVIERLDFPPVFGFFDGQLDH